MINSSFFMISCLVHIDRNELITLYDDEEHSNGYANRSQVVRHVKKRQIWNCFLLYIVNIICLYFPSVCPNTLSPSFPLSTPLSLLSITQTNYILHFSALHGCFIKKVKINDLEVFRFSGDMNTFADPHEHLENRCYCDEEEIENCLKSGLRNMEPCISKYFNDEHM